MIRRKSRMIRELIMQDELMRNRELLIAASGNHFCYFCYFCGTSFAAGGKPFSDSPKIQIKGKRRKFSNYCEHSWVFDKSL